MQGEGSPPSRAGGAALGLSNALGAAVSLPGLFPLRPAISAGGGGGGDGVPRAGEGVAPVTEALLLEPRLASPAAAAVKALEAATQVGGNSPS